MVILAPFWCCVCLHRYMMHQNSFFLKSKAKHQRREIISCCIEIPSGVVLRFALALQLNLCYTPSLLTGPQIGPFWSVWSSTGTSFSPRGETKILWYEALAAGDHGGQRWLDDSWATHAMAGLVLVSPLGVWGALAAAHALLQLTGHFAFNGRGLLWLPPATLLDSGTSGTSTTGNWPNDRLPEPPTGVQFSM